MRKFRLHIVPVVGFFFLAALVLIPSGAHAASFTASLDRDTISLGQQATLTLRFDGDAPQTPPPPSEVSGLNFGYVGHQSMDLNINGVSSSIVTFTYVVTPTQTGEFTIPIVATDASGDKVTATPLKLIVQKANAPTPGDIASGSQVAFMKLTLPQQKVYDGQTLTAQLQIYLRDDVQNYGQPQFTATPADGLTIGKSAGGTQFRTQIGNRVYTVIPISLALTVTKTGSLSLGPFTASMVIVLPSRNGGNDLFSPFVSGEQKQVTLATEQVNAQSLPMPAENAPANFNGAIGDYTMTVTAGPTNVTVGDPITVRVQIAGRGSLDTIKLPDQTGWNDFKIFAPTSKTETSDQLGLEGTKTFEEIVTPQNTDIHTLPEFSFSFFNPDDGKYHTLTQPPEQLIVRAGGSTPLPTIATAKNFAQENQTPQDILPIKENLGTLAKNSAPLILQPVFLAAQTLPILAFLAAFIWRKRVDSLANNPRLRRRRAVAQLIQIGIGDLRKFAAENNSEEFFALLFRLLQEQLGERLDCPATAITENVVEENSVLRGAPDAIRNDLRELFQLCNQARYAPIRGSAELNSVAAQFEKTVGELQTVKNEIAISK